MGYAEASITLAASPEKVWAVLNDIARTPEWVTGLTAAEMATEGTVGAGSAYRDYNRLGPFRQVTLWRILVFEPLRRQVHVSESAALPSTMTLALAPAGTGTRLTMSVEYRLLPQLGPIGRLLERVLMNRLLGQVLRDNQLGLERHLAATTP